MSTEIHLGEGIIIGFAALTLLATIAIALFAFHLSTDFGEMRTSIDKLSKDLENANEAERRFSLQSEMLLQVTNNLYRINSLFLIYYKCQAEELIRSGGNKSVQERRFNVLISELNLRNKEIEEYIDHFKILIDPTAEKAQILIDKRPTRSTVFFLKSVLDVAEEPLKSTLRAKYEGLLGRIIGYDATRWTGFR